MLSITLMMPAQGLAPGSTFERQVVAHTVGELEAHLGGRAYLWQWCTAMTETTRRNLSLSELDAFSTAEKYGFVVVEVAPDKQWWWDKSLDTARVGQ